VTFQLNTNSVNGSRAIECINCGLKAKVWRRFVSLSLRFTMKTVEVFILEYIINVANISETNS